MRSGDLKQRITIQHLSESVDLETGNRSQVWVDFCTVWASVDDISTKDMIADRANQGTLQSRAVIRYSSKTKEINTKMRVKFDGKLYQIDGEPKRDKKDRKTYLTLNLAEPLKEWSL